jgi:hypothetical protein
MAVPMLSMVRRNSEVSEENLAFISLVED